MNYPSSVISHETALINHHLSSIKFGSKCIVVAIDAKKSDQSWNVYTYGGRKDTGINVGEPLTSGNDIFGSIITLDPPPITWNFRGKSKTSARDSKINTVETSPSNLNDVNRFNDKLFIVLITDTP